MNTEGTSREPIPVSFFVSRQRSGADQDQPDTEHLFHQRGEQWRTLSKMWPWVVRGLVEEQRETPRMGASAVRGKAGSLQTNKRGFKRSEEGKSPPESSRDLWKRGGTLVGGDLMVLGNQRVRGGNQPRSCQRMCQEGWGQLRDEYARD